MRHDTITRKDKAFEIFCELDKLLRRFGYSRHHIATHGGYCSRKRGPKVIPYAGRFGVGYKLLYPRWDSGWKVYVHYYICD